MPYDVIVVGAGPAGLMASWILEKSGLNYLVLEKGTEFPKRNRENAYDVSYGFGGAGLFSDGKLSYAPSASKLWTQLDSSKLKNTYNELKMIFKEINVYLKEWEDTWTKKQGANGDNIKKYDSIYLNLHQRKELLQLLYCKLSNKVVLNQHVNSIKFANNQFVVTCDDARTYIAKKVIIATGKASTYSLFENEANDKWEFWAEMGVRIEVNNKDFLPMDKHTLDYKMIEIIDNDTEIRTFCSCKNGVVRTSLYDDRITFNGEAVNENEEKSNIGIVVRTRNINGIYAEEMRKCYENNITMEIDMKEYYHERIIIGKETDTKIKKFIDKIIEKDCNGKVFGPEIEKFGYYPKLNSTLSHDKGLYFVGDCVASFRGLLAAFISGGYVANLLTEVRKKNFEICMNKLKIKKSDTEDMKMIFTAQSKVYFYCRDVICQYVLEQGKLPINPFRVFDYFLNDRVDRDLIRRGNNQLIKLCEELWVFGPIADGVLFEIASAIEQGKKMRFFTIGTNIKDIKEISTSELTFEPEVHARQIKKQDIIDFISSGNLNVINDKYSQISLHELLERDE